MMYVTGQDNSSLKGELLDEQRQFCAYTEIYCDRHASVDVEHYDPRLKDTPSDSYENWYAVKHLPNMKKGKVARFKVHLPLPLPTALSSISPDIGYNLDEHQFYSKSENQSVKNLIKLLRLNYEPFRSDRKEKHDFLSKMKITLGNDFINLLLGDSGNLSFHSMLLEAFPTETRSIQQMNRFPV